MFPSYLEVEKTSFLAISSLTNPVAAIWREKKVDPCYLETKKCSSQHVRSKEKDYDIYLKSEKLFHSQQEHEKNVSQLFGSGTKLVPSYFEPEKHCCISLEREKSGSLLFGDQKMQFTTVRSKQKDYNIYLKSEKLVHSQQEHEKNVLQLFGSGKKKKMDYWFLSITSLTNTVAAIWREKKVDPCYLETKNCSSQLLGTSKKIMTSI